VRQVQFACNQDPCLGARGHLCIHIRRHYRMRPAYCFRSFSSASRPPGTLAEIRTGGWCPRSSSMPMVSAVSICPISAPLSDEMEHAFPPPASSSSASPSGPQLSMTTSATSYSFLPEESREGTWRVCSSDVTATSGWFCSLTRNATPTVDGFALCLYDAVENSAGYLLELCFPKPKLTCGARASSAGYSNWHHACSNSCVDWLAIGPPCRLRWRSYASARRPG